MNGQVRIWKESEQAMGTHFLKSTDRQTSQDMERIWASEGYSPTIEYRWVDKLGHKKNTSKQGALTNWRAQMDGQVRTWLESEQVKDTHFLESTEEWTSKDTKRIWASEGHLLPKEHRWMNKLGHGINLNKQGALTNWRVQMNRQLRTWKES